MPHPAKKSMKSQADRLAAKGRMGDTEIAHVTPGERVVPIPVQQMNPDLMRLLDMAYGKAGMDPNRYVVNDTKGHQNPKTGVPEYFSEGDGPNGQGQDGGESGSGPGGMGGGGSEADHGAAEAGMMGSQGGVSGADPASAVGHAGPSGSGTNNSLTDVLDRAVRNPAINRAVAMAEVLDKMQEFGNRAKSAAEEAGISYSAGTDPGFSGTDGPGMPGDGAGGAQEPRAAQSAPPEDNIEDPTTDEDEEEKDPRRLTVSRDVLNVPLAKALREAYGGVANFNSDEWSPVDALTYAGFPTANRNPVTGLQMFAADFDPNFYLAQNPDVKAAVDAGQISAEDHYTQYGSKEGRAPSWQSQSFDESYYLSSNPDVKSAVDAGQITAKDHYTQYGAKEGRNPNQDIAKFNPSDYLSMYADVNQAVARGDTTARQHYLTYGGAEGRKPYRETTPGTIPLPRGGDSTNRTSTEALPAWLRGYNAGQPVTNAIEVFSALTPDRRRRFVSSRNRRYSPAFAG